MAAEFQKKLAAYEITRRHHPASALGTGACELIQQHCEIPGEAADSASEGEGFTKERPRNPTRTGTADLRHNTGSFRKLWRHGSPTFFVEKDKGVFTIFRENHSVRPVTLSLSAPAGLQSALIGDAPEMYFKPPYVGSSGWIGIVLDQFATKHSKCISAKPGKCSARKSRVSDSRKALTTAMIPFAQQRGNSGGSPTPLSSYTCIMGSTILCKRPVIGFQLGIDWSREGDPQLEGRVLGAYKVEEPQLGSGGMRRALCTRLTTIASNSRIVL